jgi:hypothetical protein
MYPAVKVHESELSGLRDADLVRLPRRHLPVVTGDVKLAGL